MQNLVKLPRAISVRQYQSSQLNPLFQVELSSEMHKIINHGFLLSSLRHLTKIVCRYRVHSSAEDNIYAPTAVNGDIPPFKYWGWLDPAGGLLTTVNDLAQVSM